MISDLPNDLESEILSRVPAKSLWELKTTCKRWYALFRDPKFVEKNKKLGEAVRESILLSNLRVYSIAGDLHGLHNKPSIDFKGSLKDSNFSKIFHCDGLMLCSTEENTRLVVWNPCTGQRRSIKARTCYGSNDTYALGYSKSWFWYYRKDKKVWVVECEIYELSSGSWRVLDSFTRDYLVYFDGMSLKGDAYFVAGNKEGGFFLLKFDFMAERFVRLPLPIPSFHLIDKVALSVVRDEKLSLLHLDVLQLSDVIKIWVTDKVDEETNELSWRSDFVLRVDFDKFELGDLVMRVSSFLLDEENKVAVCCDVDTEDEDRTRIHIVGVDMYKLVYKEITHPSPPRCRPLVITYVPSLVQI